MYLFWCARAAEQSTRVTQSDYAEGRELVAQESACKDAEFVHHATFREGQDERQEAYPNLKVKPKQALGNCCGKTRAKKGLSDRCAIGLLFEAG